MLTHFHRNISSSSSESRYNVYQSLRVLLPLEEEIRRWQVNGLKYCSFTACAQCFANSRETQTSVE